MDNLDLKLISLLCEKEYSNKDLSSMLKKKPETISVRVDKLLENSTITHFYLNFDFSDFGYSQIKYYLKLYDIKKESRLAILQYLNTENNVIWTAEIDGQYDIAFSFLVQNISEIFTVTK